ncbi:MAG: hypothetical protein GWP19_15090 [Planctomycetia bacterium]|nr:hypothetical protein [Planctomycetia bacterium]
MKLEELRKEYATQDNRMTAYPIYVMVQELICIGVMADGYSVNNYPYGAGETKIAYKHRVDMRRYYKDKRELVEVIQDYYYPDENKAREEEGNIEKINISYIWYPVEFFLTIKGAEEYMRCNAHNHGKLRTYVSHFERRNFEMRELLKTIGFKVDESGEDK